MAVAAMPNYIPIKEAAKRLNVTVKTARALLKSGKIQGGVMPDGEIIVVADSVPEEKKIKKEDLPEYKKYAHLKGAGISINEASREFGIPSGTITRWMQSGIIARLGSDGYRTLIDKADISYCAEIYHRSSGQGKHLFNPDGTPYKKSTSMTF